MPLTPSQLAALVEGMDWSRALAPRRTPALQVVASPCGGKTQGARRGATKPCGHGLIGLVEAPPDMDANAIWGLLLAEWARHAAELEARG